MICPHCNTREAATDSGKICRPCLRGILNAQYPKVRDLSDEGTEEIGREMMTGGGDSIDVWSGYSLREEP